MIQDNDFDGESHPFVNNNPVIGIKMLGQSGGSIKNTIKRNIWTLEKPLLTDMSKISYHTGIEVHDQSEMTICGNKIFDTRLAMDFYNLRETVLSDNELGWIEAGVWVHAMIGEQEDMGNQWTFPVVDNSGTTYGPFIVNPVSGFHASCQGDPFNSLFTVHTEQATSSNDYTHPYYPFVIKPSALFYLPDPPGAPRFCPISPFTEDFEVQRFDARLADGDNDESDGMTDAEVWSQARGLFRKLSSTPSYLNAYPAFPSFLAQHQNSNLGKFYRVDSLMRQAGAADTTLLASALGYVTDISDKLAEIDLLDSLLDTATSPSVIAGLRYEQEVASDEIVTALEHLQDLQMQYDGQKDSLFQQATDLNSTITASTTHEANEKAVNTIELNALLTQGGLLTEADVSLLVAIAAQCPRTGGTSVVRARALLDDCYEEPGVNDYSSDCMGDWPEGEGERTMLQVATEKTGIQVGNARTSNGVIILDVPFEPGSRFSVFDISGRALASGTLNQDLVIQIPTGWISGVYACTVTYPSGGLAVQKVVITK